MIFRKFHVLLVVFVVLLVPVFASAETLSETVTIEPLPDVKQLTVNGQSSTKAAFEASGRQQFIVEMAGAPLLASVSAESAPLQRQPSSVSAAAQRIEREQRAFSTALNRAIPSAETHFQYQQLLNGFSITIPADQLQTLYSLPNVVRVTPAKVYDLHLDASVRLIDAPTMWSAAGGVGLAGDGIKIAFIDTGIEPTNPMFRGNGYTMPAGFPKGYCATDDATFCNGKVIAARYYGESGAVPAGASTDEVASPLDRVGHGSHVAGIAAGNVAVSADIGFGTPTITGVAPRAHIMAYKACWRGVGCPEGALLAAFEDAVSDGADIINASWGSDPGQNYAISPFTTVVRNAIDAGVTVVFSAGNNGGDSRTVTCPACIPETIAVGTSTTSRLYGTQLEATGPGTVPSNLANVALVPSSRTTALASDLSAEIAYSGLIDGGNVPGCNAWTGNVFDDKIALVTQGGCTVAVKAGHAAAAGARSAYRH